MENLLYKNIFSQTLFLLLLQEETKFILLSVIFICWYWSDTSPKHQSGVIFNNYKAKCLNVTKWIQQMAIAVLARKHS